MSAMKIFIATLITSYTIEADPAPNNKFPEPQMDRIGVGLVGPKGDVKVLIRRRCL